MLWQIEVLPRDPSTDSLGATVAKRLASAGLDAGAVSTARLYLVDGPEDVAAATALGQNLFWDPVIETVSVHRWETYEGHGRPCVTVFKRPGVMDPVEAGIRRGALRLGQPLASAATALRYDFSAGTGAAVLQQSAGLLSNPAIEDARIGDDRFPPPRQSQPRTFQRREVPLVLADDTQLLQISRDGGLSLSLVEMQAIRQHFADLKREPTDIELETLAQTWSEHCKHKTLAGRVRYRGDPIPGEGSEFTTQNLLKETIKEATSRLGRDFCLSVFVDNAGIIAFDGDQALCIKVETHNHPSAIEPYGGAGTGVGGVIRDILGTGLGARPVASVDVFCVGPPNLTPAQVPRGAQHPIRILKGVVAGVRDYGNQMGIPTIAGAVVFEPRYVGNPLVYCGTVGIMPVDAIDKDVHPGDAIVAIGGRTGRDGIHGATFSSVELHEDSESLDSGAVQIGNAITEKKVLDVLLAARDRRLYRGVTDCGAGGFSSAVGEMGERVGARVYLERAPLKYAGLSPTEIWISEAQERMVLAVPPPKVAELLQLCGSEDVEAVILGEFTGEGRLELLYEGQEVGNLDMRFVHDGLPRVEREASWSAPILTPVPSSVFADPRSLLFQLLSHPDVASKEWIIRQYDHEVQAGSVVKPLVGTRSHGPSDGSVVAPILGSSVGFALGCGIHPRLGDIDPYHMAQAVIDEAVRNVVAVGGDPDHCAILDNFCWGNTNFPDRLGGLVRASFGCRDGALAFNTPFISGKDSLNNEFKVQDRTIVIPPTLLITALARVPDVHRAVTMDLKQSGSVLILVGETRPEFAGSLTAHLAGVTGSGIPTLDPTVGPRISRAVHAAIREGWVRACHDLSEGGLAVTLGEMVLSGEIGARVNIHQVPVAEQKDPMPDTQVLFAESLSRFVLEIAPEHVPMVQRALGSLPWAVIGETTEAPELVVLDRQGRPLLQASAAELEAQWRPPLSQWLDDGHPAEQESRHG